MAVSTTARSVISLSSGRSIRQVNGGCCAIFHCREIRSSRQCLRRSRQRGSSLVWGSLAGRYVGAWWNTATEWLRFPSQSLRHEPLAHVRVPTKQQLESRVTASSTAQNNIALTSPRCLWDPTSGPGGAKARADVSSVGIRSVSTDFSATIFDRWAGPARLRPRLFCSVGTKRCFQLPSMLPSVFWSH